MQIMLVGVNHRTTPIEMRERLAFRSEQLPDAFARLRTELGLQEAAILSTCNRVEIYAGAHQLDGAAQRLERFLCERAGNGSLELDQRLYRHAEAQSVRHLFCVASGLDSMVLGENEILHQVKRAYEQARDHQATGKLFNALFQRALNAAKAVRTRTAIGRGGTSIGSVAVELAQKVFGRISNSVTLLIGAGKIGELTLKRLAQRGARDLRIMNRSIERAERAACGVDATPLGLEQLPRQLLEADIIISSTSAGTHLLHREEVARSMRQRHQRPLCLIDLGVPRNVEPSVAQLENVYLFNIDDLQGLVHGSQADRQLALQESRDIIEHKVEQFLAWRRAEFLGNAESS